MDEAAADPSLPPPAGPLMAGDDAATNGGSAILEDLESSLSNSVRITERAPVEGDDLNAALEELYVRLISSGV